MFKGRKLAAALGVLVGLAPTLASAQNSAKEIEIVMALPAATLTFSAPFIAEDAGFYKKEGLHVTHRNIVGVGSVNAVIAGSADFTMGTGPVFLRAAAQGQRLFAIVNLVDRPLVELVLRKDVADAAGITDKTPLAERARAMKGRTIGIQGVGSIVHAWQRLVARRGGLDLEKDVRIAPMDPPAMLPALENKAIDGYATSMPFTTQAIVKGSAVMLAAAVSDAPDLVPFAYGLVYARPETCRDQREKCVRMARALAGAAKFIREKPTDALAILKKRFDKLDPVVLAAAWDVTSKAHALDARITTEGLTNSQRVSIEAGLLDPKDALSSFDGLFTDEFLR
jgi:ABC-type nitrate/sulfonate/bicarbonate transport system substrate-binding protein